MTSSRRVVLRTLVLLFIAQALDASAQTRRRRKPFQATCPIKGDAAKEDSFAMYRGKKVYFCCPACPLEFEITVDPFLAGIHRQFLQTGQMVQIACPLTGKPADSKQTVDFDGVKVAFANAELKNKVAKARGDAQLEMVFADISKGFTLQADCPVTGKPIDPKVTTKYKGRTVYFANEEARNTFRTSPEKYVAKLPKSKQRKK